MCGESDVRRGVWKENGMQDLTATLRRQFWTETNLQTSQRYNLYKSKVIVSQALLVSIW